jgi:diaminohydroxyphosphoribosylaminopyrimidine deaminase/5-amino-6-(5-phosphoribosylamino)uracil reductase
MSQTIAFSHEIWMQRCLNLAEKGLGQTAPNPMVGSVLVYQNHIIGEGYHHNFGEAHAEVNAIRNVPASLQHLIPEATLYVSLEPCNHFGKTPPCSHLIAEKGIKKVVVATQDPFEKVNGSGIQFLQNKGIEVILGILQQEATFLNRRFFTFHQKKRPYIILKYAQTSNKRMAPAHQQTYWISNRISRILTHHWRSQEQAILVGYKTALLDNPALDVRYATGKNPIPIIIDSLHQLPEHLQVFSRPHLRLSQKNYPQLKPENLLQTLLQICQEQKIQSILVEGGSKTLQQFIDANLWDEARVFTAKNEHYTQGIQAPNLPTTPSLVQQIDNNLLSFYFSS